MFAIPSLDGTPIGQTTPAAGAFTNLSATGTLTGIPGRLLNVRVIAASGMYTPTAGTNSIIAEIQGGGGGGSGAAATTSTTWSTGIGGGSGAYIKHRMTSGFSGLAMTVGAAGAAGSAGTAGGNGGSTVFGSLTAPGGLGGIAPTTSNGPTNSTNLAQVSTAVSGGNIMNVPGANATPANGWMASNFLLPSMGANSLLGSGGQSGFNNTNNAQAGSGHGAGGGAGNTTTSQAATNGGAGSQGVIMVWEFA